MVRIALVEDQKKWIDLISSFIEKYKTESKSDIQLTVFEDGLSFIRDYKSDFDLIKTFIENRTIHPAF